MLYEKFGAPCYLVDYNFKFVCRMFQVTDRTTSSFLHPGEAYNVVVNVAACLAPTSPLMLLFYYETCTPERSYR